MLISKFDLYNPEWLELVFEDRNKAYGAYDLRQNYANNMVRAMVITFLGVGLLCGATIIFRSAPPQTMYTVDVKPPVIPAAPRVEPPVKRTPPPVSHTIKPLPAQAAQQTIKVVPPVATDDAHAQKPVIDADIKGAIGTVDTKGPAGPPNVLPVDQNPGTGGPAVDDKTIYTTAGVDVMPEPVGGDKAWAKFLGKNLRYPSQAQDDGISGRVIVSFIIEKDGTLSNITVLRPAGNGFDEEALRVLKLAKAWKPGMQNGQPVRVRFMLPVNFQTNTDNN